MKKALLLTPPKMRAVMTLLVGLFACASVWAQHYAIISCDPYGAGQVQIGTDTNWGSLIDGSCLDLPEPGQTVYFTFEPFTNYTFTGLRYDGLSSDDVTALSDGLYSFVMPDVQMVTVYVEFQYSPPPVVGVEINETNFPDANFRTWLLSQSYGQDGVLGDTEIAAVTKIVAQGCGIQDLTGIEYFTALNELNVGNLETTPAGSRNSITSINLSANTLLRKLDVYDIGIASLDVSGCQDLRNLNCGNGALEALDVTQNPDLMYLSCANNQITALNLENNPNLALLECSSNQLTSLSLTQNTNLEQLFCDNNQLPELDLSNQSLLMILNCYDNQLTSLVLNSNNLYQLYCYDNQIKGQAMDDLISSLSNFGGYMVVIDLESETEQNEMTDNQVAVARAKGWSVEAWLDDDFVPYPFDENEHLYVDLGLPSGTLWATTNIGALQPYRVGLFFAWGDTEGRGTDVSDGYWFNWENYKWGEVISEETFFTKYCSDSSRGLDGFTDGKFGLAPEDDAAYVNWGPEWRMPTKEQFEELLSECTWTPMDWNVDGYDVEGPNGNSIFLPVTGWRLDDMLLDGGAYWSRTSNPNDVGGAYQLAWDVLGWYEFGGRCNGQCVRPVVNVSKTLELADAADNSEAIEAAAAGGDTYDVTLADRTLYKDGSWNTLCLPFGLTLSGSVLEGDNVQLKTLSGAQFSGGTLNLTFADATDIVAGKPYLIKWDDSEDDLVEPTFTGVTIESAETSPVEIADVISFVGCFSPTDLSADNKTLYIGDANTLYYPTSGMSIGSCRAYFTLLGNLVCGETMGGSNSINSFGLNFGDENETSGIVDIDHSPLTINHSADSWYDLSGRELSEKPTAKGIYIHSGKKVVIK